MGNIGKYFNRSEIACFCGCGFDSIDPSIIPILDTIRAKWGHGMRINSGCRCTRHNSAVGGHKNSAHLLGKAVDIKVVNSEDRFILLQELHHCNITSIGIYKDFVHFDLTSNSKVWVG